MLFPTLYSLFRITYRVPTILARQYILDTISLEASELMAEFCTLLLSGRTGTNAPVLGKETGLLRLRLLPIMPSCGKDMTSHLTTDKHRFPIGPPRTAKVHLLYPIGCRKMTIHKHVAIGYIPRSGRRREIASPKAMDCATIEYSRRRSKDEINSTLYVTVLKILAAILPEVIQRILIAQEAAAAKDDAVAPHKTGYRLPYTPGGILEGEILTNEIRSIDIAG